MTPRIAIQRTLSGIALAAVAVIACSDGGAPAVTGPGGAPLPTDLQLATLCAENALEDFGEVTHPYLLLVEKIHSPFKTLPIDRVAYSMLTGLYEHYIDLDDDGVAEARVNGRVRSSSNIDDGLQAGEGFGARWDVKDPVAPFTPHARGAFGNGALTISTVRITLTQMVDTVANVPGTWAEPTFFAAGGCPEFQVTSLQLFLDDLDNGASIVDTARNFIPRGDIGFTQGDLSAFLIIPEPDDTATVERRKATGTATFRGTRYDCEVDLATYQATMTPQ